MKFVTKPKNNMPNSDEKIWKLSNIKQIYVVLSRAKNY